MEILRIFEMTFQGVFERYPALGSVIKAKRPHITLVHHANMVVRRGDFIYLPCRRAGAEDREQQQEQKHCPGWSNPIWSDRTAHENFRVHQDLPLGGWFVCRVSEALRGQIGPLARKETPGKV